MSSATTAIISSISHPSEIYALLKYKYSLQDKSLYTSTQSLPAPGDSLYSYALCYYYLNKTSRSFARVIQELDPELCHPVCLFYLILRGLDTIEDDMTLDLDLKCNMLRNFHEIIYQKGWTFDGNGMQEKDRILLCEFNVVIDQFLQLKPKYQETIADITKRMGNGMAEFCSGKQVITLEDYNLYTHYVAGLVGHGLTGLFVNSGLENESLLQVPELANHMGLFLQKTNILKDYLADVKEGRLYWPVKVWELYVPEGAGVESLALPENLDRALACLNHLCVDALAIVPDTLDYMSRLTNKTIFQFAAIPQLMALASIEHFFNNPLLFQKSGNKIRRGLAVKMIFASTDIESLKQVYFEYAIKLNEKNRLGLGRNTHDQSFMKMSIATSNIIKWIHLHDQKIGRVNVRKQRKSFNEFGIVLWAVAVFILIMMMMPGVN